MALLDGYRIYTLAILDTVLDTLAIIIGYRRIGYRIENALACIISVYKRTSEVNI